MLTASLPGAEKLSRHAVSGGDAEALLAMIVRLQVSAAKRCSSSVPVAVIQEAGLDGFWIHRLLRGHGIESHVVDPASIAVNRRHRRAKTEAIDGEALLRTLMAWSRGERQVCSMVPPPSPDAEDRRRLSRERGRLIKERIQHANRIKGLLAGQGVSAYDLLHRDRQTQLEALTTGDGRPLPARLRAEIRREIERLELALTQIAAVARERDALVAETAEQDRDAVPAVLLRLRSCCACAGSDRNWPRCSVSKGCSAASATAGSLRPMRAWHRARGRVADWSVSRGSPNPAIHGCGGP